MLLPGKISYRVNQIILAHRRRKRWDQNRRWPKDRDGIMLMLGIDMDDPIDELPGSPLDDHICILRKSQLHSSRHFKKIRKRRVIIRLFRIRLKRLWCMLHRKLK